MATLKLGVHCVVLTDVIACELDEEGLPQLSLRTGDKVHVTSLEPLAVRRGEDAPVEVDASFLKTCRGRPKKLG
jgi:hypothetical protein